MWILQFLPSWIFPAILCMGIITFLVTKTVSFLPQAKLIQAAAVVLVVFGTYMSGAVSNNEAWKKRVQELETKVAQAETKSAVVNTDIVEKAVTKTQIVRERGRDIIKYVDREVVKFDTTCVIPKEFVSTHNRAAEAPK